MEITYIIAAIVAATIYFAVLHWILSIKKRARLQEAQLFVLVKIANDEKVSAKELRKIYEHDATHVDESMRDMHDHLEYLDKQNS